MRSIDDESVDGEVKLQPTAIADGTIIYKCIGCFERKLQESVECGLAVAIAEFSSTMVGARLFGGKMNSKFKSRCSL